MAVVASVDWGTVGTWVLVGLGILTVLGFGGKVAKNRTRQKRIRQKQVVKDGSTALQAGRDIRITGKRRRNG
jgi:hypothetical protein